MKSIYFDNHEMSILKSIYFKEKLDETECNKKKFKELLQKIGLSNENDEIDKEHDSMEQMLVDTYLNSSTRATIQFHKYNHIIMKGYYFIDDVIVMLDAYCDGGEFTWLPTMKFLNGSIIELLEDIEIDCENEELEGEFLNYCNKKNFLHILEKQVPEGKYRQLLKKENTQTPVLLMQGDSVLNGSKCFIYVIFKDKSAFYFKQLDSKFHYGTASRAAIVNILANWMLLQHRNLIMKMQGEENNDVI